MDYRSQLPSNGSVPQVAEPPNVTLSIPARVDVMPPMDAPVPPPAPAVTSASHHGTQAPPPAPALAPVPAPTPIPAPTPVVRMRIPLQGGLSDAGIMPPLPTAHLDKLCEHPFTKGEGGTACVKYLAAIMRSATMFYSKHGSTMPPDERDYYRHHLLLQPTKVTMANVDKEHEITPDSLEEIVTMDYRSGCLVSRRTGKGIPVADIGGHLYVSPLTGIRPTPDDIIYERLLFALATGKWPAVGAAVTLTAPRDPYGRKNVSPERRGMRPVIVPTAFMPYSDPNAGWRPRR